jgi:hypothetical protein
MFKMSTTRDLRPAILEKMHAIDIALRHLAEALSYARQADDEPAVEAVFAAIRKVKGSRQRIQRRLR